MGFLGASLGPFAASSGALGPYWLLSGCSGPRGGLLWSGSPHLKYAGIPWTVEYVWVSLIALFCMIADFIFARKCSLTPRCA